MTLHDGVRDVRHLPCETPPDLHTRAIAMPPAQSLEEFLAMIDTGRAVAPTDPAVAAARRVLDSLVGTYPSYTRQQIADISVQAHQLLQAQAGTISLLEFMHEIDQATSLAPGTVVKYEDACATFVTALTAQRKP